MKYTNLLQLAVLFVASISSADTLLVPNQYKTIQSAIDAAESGDQVLVSSGTYYEKLVMPNIGIHVIGVDGPDVTTIDANSAFAGGTEGGSAFFCYIDPKDTDPHEDDSISGFSLTGGTGSLHPVWDNHLGGAIFVLNTSPTISNCIVYGNTAEFGGGGFWVQNSESIISNVHFEDNHVYKLTRGGGAMYLWSSTATVSGCTFKSNSSDSGGALKCKGGDDSTIIGCTFTLNSAYQNGGAIAIIDSGSSFEGCTFTSNTVDGKGGAATISKCTAGVRFSSCSFENNETVSLGGAIRVHDCGVVIEKCVFDSNLAFIAGGAIVVDGETQPAVCTVSSSTFRNNLGGALIAARGDDVGMAIHHMNVASSDVDNSIFCGNVPVAINGDWNDLGGNSMSASCTFFCGGDIDANGLVNVQDILRLLSEWGSCDGISSCFSDQNEDGVVDVNDLLMLIGNWGSCG